MNRMALSLQRLLRYADEGEDMLNRIVTGDESWAHHHQPESKRVSVQWKHSNSPSIKKAISWECYACRVFGFSRSTLSLFSEAW
jgi:hypothetical protein